jgi:plastocyanin
MRPSPLAPLATLALLGLLALAAGCGGSSGGDGDPSSPTNPSANVVTVEVLDFQYSPKSVRVAPGTTVRWVMRGSDPNHTVTHTNGAFDSGTALATAGAVFQHTFGGNDNGKTFEYGCAAHRACCLMQGSVLVGTDAPAPGPGY